MRLPSTKRLLFAVGLLSLLGVIAAVLVWLRPGSAPTPRLVATFNEVDCWFTTPQDLTAQCGQLVVPGALQSYRLPVVILNASLGSNQQPLLYLGGGPGAGLGLTEDAINSWFGWYRQQGLQAPLVLMDYRSTGLAQPNFRCSPFEAAYLTSLIQPQTQVGNELYQATKQCLDIWHSRLFAPEDFTSQAMAQDYLQLLDALGVDEASIYAVSYGTRVAMALAGRASSRVAAMVLDSPVNRAKTGVNYWPTKFTNALSNYFSHCNMADSCAVTLAQLQRYLSLLAQSPRIVEIKRWDEPGTWRVQVGDSLLLDSFYSGLYSPNQQSRFEFIQQALATSELEAKPAELKELAKIIEPQINQALDSSFNYFVYYANQCLENPPYDPAVYQPSQQQSPWRQYLGFDAELSVCNLFKTQHLQRHEAPLSTPTVLLSGLLDPITPFADSELLLNQFKGGQLAGFTDAGHGVLNRTECLRGRLPKLLNPQTDTALLLSTCADVHLSSHQ